MLRRFALIGPTGFVILGVANRDSVLLRARRGPLIWRPRVVLFACAVAIRTGARAIEIEVFR